MSKDPKLNNGSLLSCGNSCCLYLSQPWLALQKSVPANTDVEKNRGEVWGGLVHATSAGCAYSDRVLTSSFHWTLGYMEDTSLVCLLPTYVPSSCHSAWQVTETQLILVG